jgi:hypothetical protein
VISFRQGQLNWAGAEGTIECVVLNACETEGLGKKIRELVCLTSCAGGQTCRTLQPHNSLYEACSEASARMEPRMDSHMDSGGGAARGFVCHKKDPHLHPASRDYVCLLGKDTSLRRNLRTQPLMILIREMKASHCGSKTYSHIDT